MLTALLCTGVRWLTALGFTALWKAFSGQNHKETKQYAQTSSCANVVVQILFYNLHELGFKKGL